MRSLDTADDQLPQVGDYDLLRRLPAYGTIEPWVARKAGEVELVIVKRLQAQLAGVATVRNRFAREGLLAQHVNHENLVNIREVGEDNGEPFLVTDFVVGPRLSELLITARNRQVVLPPPLVAAVILPVLEAIAHAHEAKDDAGRLLGIVHRDLAPKSIMVTLTGDIRVIDFGVAQAQVQDFQTAPGLAVGTAEYLCPEQVRAEPVTPLGDVYTLGVVLHEMLAGQPLIDADRPLLDRLREVASTPVPSLVTVPGVSNSLAAVVAKATSKEPSRRFASARAFTFALQEALPHPESKEGLASFVRQLLPNEERRVLEILEEVRIASAKLKSALEPEAERTEVTRLRMEFLPESDEPPEPSVMTMPGQLLTSTGRVIVGEPDLSELTKPKPKSSPESGRHQAALSGSRPARRRTIPLWLIPAVLTGAVLLAGGAWWSLQAPSVAVEAPAAPLEASAPGARAVANAEEISPEPPPADTPPAVAAPAKTKARGSSSGRRVAPKSPQKAPPPQAAPSKTPPPQAATSKTPPPKAAPPPPPDLASRGLQARLTRLRANPKDVKAFDNVRNAVARLAKKMPPGVRRQVEADLSAADRSLDVELLQSALDRVRAAGY